jgi:tryptophan synthase alpha chain
VLPLLIAPTTPAARAVEIAEASSGFVYIVSRLGVTSARTEPDFGWIGERVAALRARTAAPLAIGFGISTPDHVRAACRIADAAIVGSALIDAFAGLHGSEASGRVGSFIAELRRATTRSG